MKVNKILGAEKSKSIGNFGRMRCQSATKLNQEGAVDKQMSDLYKLRPLVGSGISYLWDRFFENKHVNDDLKKEINEVFTKIQTEIQLMLENRIDKIKSYAQNFGEVQENTQLKEKIGELFKQLSDEKAVNARLMEEFTNNKVKQFDRTEDMSYGELETRANLETEGDDRISFFKESYDYRTSKDNKHLKFDIEQKQRAIKGLDDTLFELEKELKEITGSYSSVTVSSFNCSAEKEKHIAIDPKIDPFKQSSPIQDIHGMDNNNTLTDTSETSRRLKPEDL